MNFVRSAAITVNMPFGRCGTRRKQRRHRKNYDGVARPNITSPLCPLQDHSQSSQNSVRKPPPLEFEILIKDWAATQFHQATPGGIGKSVHSFEPTTCEATMESGIRIGAGNGEMSGGGVFSVTKNRTGMFYCQINLFLS